MTAISGYIGVERVGNWALFYRLGAFPPPSDNTSTFGSGDEGRTRLRIMKRCSLTRPLANQTALVANACSQQGKSCVHVRPLNCSNFACVLCYRQDINVFSDRQQYVTSYPSRVQKWRFCNRLSPHLYPGFASKWYG